MQNIDKEIIATIYKHDGYVQSSKGLKIALDHLNHPNKGATAGELFAMSLAACLSSTLSKVLAAHQQTHDFSIDVKHQSHIESNKHDGYYFSYHVVFKIPHILPSLGEKYIALTKKLCPISKMLTSYSHYTSELIL